MLRMEAILYDPTIPSSVEIAIKQTLAVIDELLVDFKCNSVLEPMVDQLKAQYLKTIENRVIMSQSYGPVVRQMPAIARVIAKVWTIVRASQ